MSRIPPSNIDAEEAVLGSCLLSDVAIDDTADLVAPDDFYKPAHQHIYAAILENRSNGRADAVTVAAALLAAGFNGEPYDVASLHRLSVVTPAISLAAKHARLIADAALRRRIIFATSDVADRAFAAGGDAGTIAEYGREVMAGLDMPAEKAPPARDIDSFLAAIDTTHDWLIEGFLERKDRLLVTAGEGAGKSVLLAQLAVMAAAGIHPWTHRPVAPRNVLIVDLENSERLLSRRLSPLRAKVARELDPQRLRIEPRPDGIDLTSRNDRRWLSDRVRTNATELLVIGPAYRMSSGVAERGDVGGEDQARKVTKALDELRIKQGVTLILETHAPHGNNYGRDLRPFGSSVWLRWPEFGIGLKREDEEGQKYSVEHWRGARDYRVWPTTLLKGGSWPWMPIMPTGTFNTGRGAA